MIELDESGKRWMKIFDYDRYANATWSSGIVSLVAAIRECKGRQESFLTREPAVLDKLLEIAKVQSVEASNKIEGIVTTNARLKGLCEEKTTPRNRSEKEIAGYREALKTIHEHFMDIPLTSNFILQLHGLLYRYAESGIGGRFKNVQNYIQETRADGTNIIRFTPLEPFLTPQAVDALCENYNRAIDSGAVDPLILIPIFVADFLCIHPFNDGNGRMSRLLTTLLLQRSGFVVGKYVSLERKIEETKETYYEALKLASVGWMEDKADVTPFIDYLLGIVLSAYRDFESRVAAVGEKLPAIEQVRQAVKRTIGRFTRSDIMELCPSIEKSSVASSLKKLVESGEISVHGSGRGTFYLKNN